MVRILTFIAAGAAVLVTGVWAQEETPYHRLRTSSDVLHDILGAPDGGIPRELLEKAQCVVVVPGLKKAAFLAGGDYGRGYAMCRHAGGWSGPAATRLGGGSFGAQIGAEPTDVVMPVMDRKGMKKLAADKFALGADAAAAAGPVGRTAAADSDISLNAETLSWSRTHGVFAGVSLDGTAVSKDSGEDRKIYGSEVSKGPFSMVKFPRPRQEAFLLPCSINIPKSGGVNGVQSRR